MDGRDEQLTPRPNDGAPPDDELREKYGAIVDVGIALGYVASGTNVVAIYAKIFLLWFLGFFMIARFATNVIFDWFPLYGNRPGTTSALEPWNLVFLVLGSYFTLCYLRRIIWPRVEPETFTPTLKFDVSGWTVAIPNPTLAPAEFLFLTTHPLYFFIDILGFGVAWLFAYISMEGSPYADPTCNGVNYFCYWLLFWMTGASLVFRQFSWFILGRKVEIDSRARWESVARPLVYLYSFLAFIGILSFVLGRVY